MIEPIDDLESLWTWQADNLPTHEKLTNYGKDKLLSGEREILVCHDMKGGYLEEERDEGCSIEENKPYVFLNWWNIDVFCYFSHHFITIPPSGYINAAHKHGCLVLGTFITEWKPGSAICEKILENEESVQKTAEKLCSIATGYGFDGWLINIENPIQKEKIGLLELFLKKLTKLMRNSIEHGRIVWYDSVTSDGNLDWQNELNAKNKIFYDACDGIYLNYCWKDEQLLNSADFGEVHRIYVGIDCFARGCIGGWQCQRSFAKATFLQMSVALFAPGWICESFPKDDPISMGMKFWNLLSKDVPSRPILNSFDTDFHPGLGNETFCLNSMNVQPHLISNNIIPIRGGGLLILRLGSFTIFNFDVVIEKMCSIEIESVDELEILVNGCVSLTTRQGTKHIAKFDGDRLTSIGILTNKEDTILKAIRVSISS